jgi:hypothetical protein
MFQAVAWYEKRQPGLGAELLDAVNETISVIVKHPTLGARIPPDNKAKTRRLLVSRFPFQIVYLASTDAIVVVALAHLKRRPGYWKGRL